MGTVLFTDYDVLVFALVGSAIALSLAVLLVSTTVDQRVERLESKIRQLVHQ
jgi:hypothetical protein